MLPLPGRRTVGRHEVAGAELGEAVRVQAELLREVGLERAVLLVDLREDPLAELADDALAELRHEAQLGHSRHDLAVAIDQRAELVAAVDVGEHVAVDRRLLIVAERAQDEHGCDAGAVLALAAVEEKRRAAHAQAGEELLVGGVVERDRGVELHEGGRDGALAVRVGAPRREEEPHEAAEGHVDVVAEAVDGAAEALLLDAGQVGVGQRPRLAGAPQVEHVAQAEGLERLELGGVEAAGRRGAVDEALTHHEPGGHHVAAEVAQVALVAESGDVGREAVQLHGALSVGRGWGWGRREEAPASHYREPGALPSLILRAAQVALLAPGATASRSRRRS